MNYILLVFDAKGKEVFRKIYTSVSGNFMMEIYKDYEHLGGKGGRAEFFPY
jgi:hypothetical protein